MPSSCRNPRNNSSSSALSAVNLSCCSTGNRPSLVLPPPLHQLLPQPTPLIALQQINQTILRRRHPKFTKTLPPPLLRLVRHTRYQIKPAFSNPGRAQNRDGLVNARPP